MMHTPTIPIPISARAGLDFQILSDSDLPETRTRASGTLIIHYRCRTETELSKQYRNHDSPPFRSCFPTLHTVEIRMFILTGYHSRRSSTKD